MVFARHGYPAGRHPCRAAGLRASSVGYPPPCPWQVRVTTLALRRTGDLSVSRELFARANRVLVIKVIPASQSYIIARFYAIGGIPESLHRVFPY